jgi:isocitrate dehydrogenase
MFSVRSQLRANKLKRTVVPLTQLNRLRNAAFQPTNAREFSSANPRIVYTLTDEAPALATYSFLPIVQAFTKPSNIDVETSDISVAARVLANFPDKLTNEQKVNDTLGELGELALKPEANIIKLPNISASVPQLRECIKELQNAGYDIPNLPETASTAEEKDAAARYNKVKGSAVNPVLREGNSDRRAPPAVKAFARKNPHSMGAWSPNSTSHVSSMSHGDFRANEQSHTFAEPDTVRIEHVAADGSITVLKDGLALEAGEILDATFLSKNALMTFLADQVADAKAKGILFSLHMKATMMKVSDPIIFGHCVRVFFAPVFEKHAATFEKLGVDVKNGFGDILDKIEKLPADQKASIEADIEDAFANGPDLAMVDSGKGITNLHVPSDVIVDASMPAMLRTSGQMWNKNDKLQDTKCVIPDSSYAGIYQACFDYCRKNGAFNPSTMGSSPNVGLMAKKAEEYGSHDKTFEVPANGTMRVVSNSSDDVFFQHVVEQGDIWRACQAKDAPIRDWVGLAVRRARATGTPAIFWLDAERGHDREMIKKVNAYLKDHDISGLDITISPPADACRTTLERMGKGQDTISVTGNVLRDYNTDLFPILELGTSAKMLSIVPLMNGGGMFETGAGGSAPKHVQQFEKENHLRWDSLGEFLALAVSLQHIADTSGHKKAGVLGKALDDATTEFLLANRSPSRKVNELDNRGSHFYLALYWAQHLAKQSEDAELRAYFSQVAQDLQANEATIVKELVDCQGSPMDVGGYYYPQPAKCDKAMRPSPTLNGIINKLLG